MAAMVPFVIALCVSLAFAADVEDSNVAGHWTLERMSLGPELFEFPLSSKMGDDKISLRVDDRGSGSLRLHAQVVNTLLFTASAAESPALRPFQALHIKPGFSTNMMGPQGEIEAETNFARGLAAADRWYARDGQLLVAGPAIELSFVRPRSDKAATETPVRRLKDRRPLHFRIDEHLGRATLNKAEMPNVPGVVMNEIKIKLLAKLDELLSLKTTLRNQGADSSKIFELSAPLLQQVKELKQQVRRASFKDIQPKPMPSKTVVKNAIDVNEEQLGATALGLRPAGVLV